ncbi:peptide ABC transporter substrate-binding protein [archaeon RBG_16_50_20]|nr:MAG: peptide ABC transporter substrate-binding protein [archaeon RBG_16_50_20]
MTKTVLEIKGLKKWFPITGGILGRVRGYVKAVDGVDLEIKEGETYGLVGESGSGKTTVGRCILRLIEPTAGEIIYRGQEITKLKGEAFRRVRRKFGIVFQDPYASLDPRQTIKGALTEPMKYHKILESDEEAVEKAKDLIKRVGLNEDHLYRFPHEFSGGQRQRIAVARALTTDPDVVILDEPTSFLDVSVQAQILNLLSDLQKEFNLTYLFISHNLSVIEHMSNRVGVMYLGAIMEAADKEIIYRRPEHPYTHALISALPIPNPALTRERVILSGDVPSPVDIPSGCRFRTRCPYATDYCKEKEPPLVARQPGHLISCHYELKLSAPIPLAEASRKT